MNRCKDRYYDLSAHLLYTKDVTCCKTHLLYCHEASHIETKASGSWNRVSYKIKKMHEEMCYQNRNISLGDSFYHQFYHHIQRVPHSFFYWSYNLAFYFILFYTLNEGQLIACFLFPYQVVFLVFDRTVSLYTSPVFIFFP